MTRPQRLLGFLTIAVLLGALLSACGAGRVPVKVAMGYDSLGNCPARPNCVSSVDQDAHYIPPLEIVGDPTRTWAAVTEIVSAMPRTYIAARQKNYLRAECSSLIFRFVDDLELMMKPAEGIITVRSAARLGYSDWGVNRSRVEDIRAQLRARGLVR